MNLNKLLKQKKCSCGAIHTCEIEYIYVEKNAISRLFELTKNYNNILIVLDENTYNFAGEKCKTALENKNVLFKIFSCKTPLIPNEEAIYEVEANLKGIDLIVGVGSGVIQDLCKYVSFKNNLNYFIIPTAPSMDGYASSTAIMTFNGVKTSTPCKPPKAILGDVLLLKNAPYKMIQSGYGDIIGKFSALNDWLLAKFILNEYFCPFIYRLTYNTLRRVAKLTKKLKNRDENAVKNLMEALIVTGICMSYMGNSRSASGSEHLLSHFFETVGMRYGEPCLPHGINVAYSTYHTAIMRQKLLNCDFNTPVKTQDNCDFNKKMVEFYGDSAEKLINMQNDFEKTISKRYEVYKTSAKKIKKIIKKSPNPNQILKYLTTAGLDVNEFYQTYSETKIQNAENYAKNNRVRFTLLHIYNDFI